MQSDLPLAGATPAADFFGALGRPFALASEIPKGVQVHSWGKHPLICIEQLDTSTTLRSQSLGTMFPTDKNSLVFALDVEPAEVLPQSVEWAGPDGSARSLTHSKGNELALGGQAPPEGTGEVSGAFLRGLDDYWQARVKEEAAKAGEIATLRGIYVACGTPFPAREPKSYGAALKKLTVGAVKGSTELTKPMLDFIEKHDDRKTLRGWCGGARAKLVAAAAMIALQGEKVSAEAGAPGDYNFDAPAQVPLIVRPDEASEASEASENGSAQAEPVHNESVSPPVWITEATCNLQVLNGRVFKFGPKNLIYGLNKQGNTNLVREIRLALGQRAPEFGVHDSRASKGDLFNLRAPGETAARVNLKFSNGMQFGWTLNPNGSTTTSGQIPATTYALDGVEDAVTGNSTGMIGLLDQAGIEVVPRAYVGQVLGPHLPTLVTVIKDDTTTRLQGDTPTDQLLGAYRNGLQLVLGGFKALKDAKKRRNTALKDSESVSHQNALSMDNLAGVMEALAPALGYPGFKFAAFFTDDDRRAAVMTDVSAKATSATKVDKAALDQTLNQQRYEVTEARGTLARAKARLTAIEQEGIALKQATMANPLPASPPSARELALAVAFESMFGFVPVMTEGRTGRMGCPCCPNETTVEAIAEKAAALKASPTAARFNVVRNYATIKKIHNDYTAKGIEYRTQRDVTIKAATDALAQADAKVATTEAQIAAAESSVNPVAVSAEAFVTAFIRYRELFVANRASTKWREGESAFITGPLAQAIQAFKVTAESLREYTIDRLRGLIAEFTGNDTIAIDVFGRNIVAGERAPGHDAGIMLGTSKSQTFQLIGNICSMLYGSQNLNPDTMYLAETGDVAWTEPHLSETLRGWSNNRLQWLVQSTVKPEVMPEGWTLIDLSVKG